MLKWIRLVPSLTLIVLAPIGCQSLYPDAPSEHEAMQDASDAYLAYERGDCESAARMSDPDLVEVWLANEHQYSMLLLHAFCQEIAGDTKSARRLYQDLVLTAPNSFAGRDARERLRILRLEESNPDAVRWMREAPERALAAKSAGLLRVPIERRLADFPPVPRAVGIEGYTLVEFGVTPAGHTSNPVIIESSPRFLFDGTSLRAVRKWEYTKKAGTSKTDRQVIKLVFLRQHSDKHRQEVMDMSPETEPNPIP